MKNAESLKDIAGFDGIYQISNFGNVYSLKSNKFLKTRKHNSGYISACLYKDNTPCYFLIHRLVAIAFIENPNNLPCVGHKNTVKTDNFCENLEWCTYSDNNKNPITLAKRDATYKIQGNSPMKGRFGVNHPISKAVCQYDKKMNFVAEFGSVCEAGRKTGIRKDSIYRVCLNVRKTIHGFIFKYKSK